MEILELKAEKRTTKGSKAARKLRESGQIPAILYGHKEDNIMLSLKDTDFMRLLQTRTRMIWLAFENKKESALIKDVQHDNLSDGIIHVDFSRINLDERVKLRVFIEVYGEPIGVKEGGVLTHALKEVEIECLPAIIPEKIKVNISSLGLGKALHVRELPQMEGIRYLPDAETVVVSVHQLTAEKAVSEEEMLVEPVVITKKPKEGEEGEPEKKA
ncbi:MAG: 50S ribosomal protein L25 [Planctomycetota bacterium]